MTASDNDNGNGSRLVTIPDAAAILGKSERTVRRYISSGKLATVDINGQTCVQLSALDTAQDMTGGGVQTTANADNLTGTVNDLRDRIEETLKDTIRRQEGEIIHLRQEVQAKQGTIDNLTRMLPAPKTEDTQKPGRSLLWLWITLAVLVVGGAVGVAVYRLL